MATVPQRADAGRHRSSRATSGAQRSIDTVRATAYTIPTETDEESDGTLVWDSTSIVVVEIGCGEVRGLGYTYADPTVASLVDSKLAPIVQGSDPLELQRTWAEMQVQIRQLGHSGLAAMAVSAVDIALWDLKARLLGVCLADLLGRYRDAVPIYGSGGFCNLTPEQLRDQVRGWMQADIPRVKIKVGRDPDADPERVRLVRDLVGPDVEVFVDANGAYTPHEAFAHAERFRELGVSYLEEPVSSQDVAGMAEVTRRAPPGLAVAAGEYGWNLPMLEELLGARAVHILQADVTRCGGITNLLRVDGLCKARSFPFSAHCAPAVSAHVCCAMETALHIEYFADHVRIERILFDGTLSPAGGALAPDRSRPGLGLELCRERAAEYEV